MREQKLTHKQERFVAEYIKTGNASEAYRRAYSTEKMKPETVNRRAKDLMDKGKIAARLQQYRDKAEKAALMTLEGHLEALKNLRDLASSVGRFEAAITAETNRGKAFGLYKDRVEHTGKDGGAIETRSIIRIEFVEAGK